MFRRVHTDSNSLKLTEGAVPRSGPDPRCHTQLRLHASVTFASLSFLRGLTSFIYSFHLFVHTIKKQFEAAASELSCCQFFFSLDSPNLSKPGSASNQKNEAAANSSSSWIHPEGAGPDTLVFCQSGLPDCKQLFVPEVQTHLTNPAEDRPPPAPATTDYDGLRHIQARRWSPLGSRSHEQPGATRCCTEAARGALHPAPRGNRRVRSCRSFSFSDRRAGGAHGRVL